MFSGDGREGVSKPAGKPATKPGSQQASNESWRPSGRLEGGFWVVGAPPGMNKSLNLFMRSNSARFPTHLVLGHILVPVNRPGLN